MTIVHWKTFKVTDRADGKDAPLAIGIENGMVVTQGPKSWQASPEVNELIASARLLAAEAARNQARRP